MYTLNPHPRKQSWFSIDEKGKHFYGGCPFSIENNRLQIWPVTKNGQRVMPEPEPKKPNEFRFALAAHHLIALDKNNWCSIVIGYVTSKKVFHFMSMPYNTGFELNTNRQIQEEQ